MRFRLTDASYNWKAAVAVDDGEITSVLSIAETATTVSNRHTELSNNKTPSNAAKPSDFTSVRMLRLQRQGLDLNVQDRLRVLFAVQAKCEALFHAKTAQSTASAMEMWETACADIRPYVGVAKLLDCDRNFIVVLERLNLDVAASKVRHHMWHM